MHIRDFLLSPIAYLDPEKALDGLTPAQAEQKSNGAGHSVAEIVAHMDFWQGWFLARCNGNAAPMVASAADGWPKLNAGSWPELRGRFLDNLKALARLADGDVSVPLTPAIEFPPLADYTIADALIHVSVHNAHHLGQAITIRQLQGTWPPPAGSWTW